MRSLGGVSGDRVRFTGASQTTP